MKRSLILFINNHHKSSALGTWGQKFGYEIFLNPSEETLNTLLRESNLVKCVMDANFEMPQKLKEKIFSGKIKHEYQHDDISYAKKVFDSFTNIYGPKAYQLFKSITDNPSCIYMASECKMPIEEQQEFKYREFFEFEPEIKTGYV